MPVVEYLIFIPSEAFIADVMTIEPAAVAVSKYHGVISSYAGLQVEDPNVGYLLVVWDAYESHQKVMGDPDYKKLLDILAPAHEGFLGMLHFDVQGNFEKTFSTGTTEIVQFTLKEGKAKADLEPILSTWIGNSGREEYYLQGGCVEKPEVVGCFVGYEGPANPELLKQASTLADVELKHGKLVKIT